MEEYSLDGIAEERSDDSVINVERRRWVKDPSARVAQLEAKVLSLLQEKAQVAAHHAQQMKSKEVELQKLQRYISTELQQLQQRQMEVEATAPLLKQQQQAARAALKDLVISPATYHELRQVPPDKRPLSDAVRIAVYESLQELRADNERLRLLESSAREAAQRAQHEAGRLQQENSRMAAQLAEREEDVETTSAALHARCQRLAAELEATQMQVQLLSAKGTMYDELQQQCDKLEEEARQAKLAALGHQQVKDQLAALQQHVSSKDGRIEVLQQDKAYLSREVELLAGQLQQQRDIQQRLETKVAKLKSTRDELFDRVLNAEAAVREEEQRKCQQQLAQAQAGHQADVAKLQQHMVESHAREVRLLREARDQAMADTDRAQAALRDLRSSHELLLAQQAELQQRSTLQVAQLQGELRVWEVEGARLQGLADERAAAVSEAQQQVAALQAKVGALTDSMYALEAEHSRNIASLAAQLDVVQQQSPAASQPARDTSAGVVVASSGQQPCCETPDNTLLAKAKSLRSVQLAQRCSRLEADRLALARERDELQQLLHSARSEVAVLQSRLSHISQPQALLLEQLRASEQLAQRLQQQLAAAEQRSEALRCDLGEVLRQRGNLEQVKRALVGAVRSRKQKQQQQQQQQQGLQL